jgi:putative methylase
MKKKKLEMLLQQIPSFQDPKPELEQYITPAEIAADIIYIAFQFEDIKNKKVVDLGCGTGIFSVGSCIAGAKEVIGFDVDKNAIKIAKEFANKNNLEIKYIAEDVENINSFFDTSITNPPFGAQKSNIRADRKFIEKGFQISKVIYSLHLSKTVAFIEKMILSLNGEIDFKKKYVFRMKHTFDFHSKKAQDFNVTLLRILTKK